MRSGIFRLIACLSVGLLAGCAWEEPVSPEGPAFRAVQSGNTISAPSNLTSTPISHTTISLAWKDNSSNETGFEVHRSTAGAAGAFTLFSTTGAGATSMEASGLGASSEYCHKVRAFMIKGSKTTYSAFSAVSCATTLPPPVPGAPTGVRAVPIHSTAITITWKAGSGTTEVYYIETAASDGGPWGFVSNGSPSLMSFEHDGRVPDQTICYRIIAHNQFGNSPSSPAACTAAPTAPTELTATIFEQSAVDLYWADRSALEDGYEVRRLEEGGLWNAVAILPANANGYRDAAPPLNVQLRYQIAARKDGGYSSPVYLNASVVISTTPPPAPVSISAIPSTSISITISWTSTAANAEGFHVERSLDGGSTWVTAGTAGLYDGGFTDQGRAPEQQVWYRVRAFNAAGESPPSPVASATPAAAPTNLEIVAIDDQTTEIRWTDNSSVEEGYYVETFWQNPCVYEGWCFYEPEYYGYVLPPNTTSVRVNSWESFNGVAAIKEGGFSTWLVAVGTAPATSTNASRAAVASGERKSPVRHVTPGVTSKTSNTSIIPKR